MRYILSILLMAAALGPVADAQPVSKAQRKFYNRLASDWKSERAARLSASFDTLVHLDLGRHLPPKRYRKKKAASALSTHFQQYITPIAKRTKVKRVTRDYMILDHHYKDRTGTPRHEQLRFRVKRVGGSWVITEIRRF